MSNPEIVYKNAQRYLGKNVIIRYSSKPTKKFMVYNPFKNRYIHFGAAGYEDYTLHRDRKRQHNYLKRSSAIRGNWKTNQYSANNLSRNILWK